MNSSSVTDSRRAGNRIVTAGIVAIVLILLAAAILLFMNLPDANAFNLRVEQIFVENDALTSGTEIKLLEILAQSGTAFSDVLASYRTVIFVLLVFATALLTASLVFLVTIIALNRRMSEVEKTGIQVSSLLISRTEKAVYLNNMEFKLTPAAIETSGSAGDPPASRGVASWTTARSPSVSQPKTRALRAAGSARP